MENDLIIGLRISVIGMSLTFLALGLLILVMVLLVRFFPDRSSAIEEPTHSSPTKPEDTDEQRREETAVALAVGICLLERDEPSEFRDPSLGHLLEP